MPQIGKIGTIDWIAFKIKVASVNMLQSGLVFGSIGNGLALCR